MATIPLDVLDGFGPLVDRRVKRPRSFPANLPFPPFSLKDPRIGKGSSDRVVDLVLPPFFEVTPTSSLPEEVMIVESSTVEALPEEELLTEEPPKKKTRNQKAKERRKRKYQDIMSRPDTDTWKMVHIMRKGRIAHKRADRMTVKAGWFNVQALTAPDPAPYQAKTLDLRWRIDELKAQSESFYKKAKC
ncbi:uncharacterized protein LOC128393007 [Panonychus citri]|uniref:uncharacterized protein LOC128393007 n=1 Tax=Panonychus citri TaxID=50023 RepID=UPI0023070608|nr:uncharacterized protein LOC128393007 [Panonychus citri]